MQRYYQNQFEKNACNPRLLWDNLLQAIQKHKPKHKLTSRFEVNGNFITDEHDIAESFNEYYSNVAPKLASALGPSHIDPLAYMNDVSVPEMMVFNLVNEQDVLSIVMTLKDSGAGFDGISAKLLKHIVPAISSQLTHFINLCIVNHVFPTPLKAAVITPVFKNGSRALFSNYRPISVLPVLSKILEKIMYNQLLTFVTEHNIIFDHQFGFRAKHSTYMPISILHDLITDNLASNMKTAGIYLDLARAFDTVNTDILLKKLSLYNIRDKSLDFLLSYLSNRTHRVKFNGIISGTKEVTCGVPQGSVLGPLLFLLYINDIYKVCPVAKFFLFADDTAIFYSASSINELQDKIHVSFPKITAWLIGNRLSLSVQKTFYQLYSNDASPQQLHISVGNNELNRASTIKYLGVLIDENLKFKSHITKISGIISRQIGIICRARYLLNQQLLMLLYNALILPYLSYCVCIWGSNYRTTLQPIIVAQKRAVRMIAGVPTRTHTSPLFKDLKILKFDDIVQYQILNILHDSLHGDIPKVIKERFTLNDPCRTTRSCQHFSERKRSFVTGRIVPNYKMYNYRQFSLFCRAPTVWNSIIAEHIPNINDVPFSKSFFKKVVKLLLFDCY